MDTIEDILARQNAIVAKADAEGRRLTADEVKAYKAEEANLATAREDQAVRARNTAYNTPAPGQINAAVYAGSPAKVDDTLERAFEAYLRSGKENADLRALYVKDAGIQNAQSSGTDTAGGFMVPPGFRQKLVEIRKAFGGLASLVDSFDTGSGGDIEYPSLDDTGNSGQITGEGTAVSGGSDMTFGTITLKSFKYTSSGASNAPLKVSFELLQDAAFDVVGLISRKLGERIQRKQAVDWVTGAGTTLPFGIARTALAADVTLAAGNAITYSQLVDIETALDPAYEQNAVWVMNKASWQNIRKLTGSDGRPLIMEQAVAGIDGRPSRTLLGYPVIIDQAFSTNTVLSGRWAVLGDLREAYVIRRVSNLVVIANPYSSAASGQVEYTAWERADGKEQNRKAYALAGSNAA